MKEAYIITGLRSAFGKAKKGGFRHMRSDDLSIQVIQELIKKVPGLEPSHIDDIIVGCANPEGEQGLQMGRQIAVRALGKTVPGMIINRYCASGLESIAIATAKIKAGMGHCYIAGGAESMSMIPMEGYKLAPSYQAVSEHPDYLVGMGLTAEAVAKRFDISRIDQDTFAARSHTLAAQAQDAGYFQEDLLPIQVEETYVVQGKKKSTTLTIEKDEGIRRETTVEALSKLKPVFAQGGTVTAGNSSQTSDGVAFVIVMSEEFMKSIGCSPIARLAACSVAGVEPILMGIGPCAAIPKALNHAGLNLSQIEYTELNEAFAAQALAVIREAGLNPDTTNIYGGAIALGHPLGCTGAKLSLQLIRTLHREKKKYGLVTACVGGGQGIAGIFERL